MGWGQAEEHYKSATFLTLSWDYFKVFLGKKTKVKPGETECKNKIRQGGKRKKTQMLQLNESYSGCPFKCYTQNN